MPDRSAGARRGPTRGGVPPASTACAAGASSRSSASLWQARDRLAGRARRRPGPDRCPTPRSSPRSGPTRHRGRDLVALAVFRGPRQRRLAGYWFGALSRGPGAAADSLPPLPQPAGRPGRDAAAQSRWRDRDPDAAAPAGRRARRRRRGSPPSTRWSARTCWPATSCAGWPGSPPTRSTEPACGTGWPRSAPGRGRSSCWPGAQRCPARGERRRAEPMTLGPRRQHLGMCRLARIRRHRLSSKLPTSSFSRSTSGLHLHRLARCATSSSSTGSAPRSARPARASTPRPGPTT